MREEFPIRDRGVMQAFVFNIRRDKFKDPRVRRAFNFAFDFEEMNRQLFFGQYSRIASYFEGTELAATGLPEGKELEILESIRDKIPADLFSKPYTNPVGGTPQAVRDNLRHALALLREAGYEVRNTKLVDSKTNEPFTFEFLVDDSATQRFVLFYKPSLERLGMNVNVRVVDAAQYENRLRQWDYDVIIASWPQSLSPGNEQRDFWGSQAADRPGSRNFIGIKNPAVDVLIEKVIFAKDRAETGRGHQGSRPGSAVELLRRAAVDLPLRPHGAMGSIQSSRNHAEIRPLGISDGLVVGQGKGSEGAATIVIA